MNLTNLINRNYHLHPVATTGLLILMFSAAHAQIPKFNSNSAAIATVYLDFDGHTVAGTSWNWDSTIRAKPAEVKQAGITEIFNRVAEDYRIFNINITTDSSMYAQAPATKRVRVIITPTSQWYGVAAGVAFVNSFNWGDGTPAWVFSELLEKNPKYIGEAASHEIGHTLGLQHQSQFDNNCELVTEYAEGKGDGEISWAPIMGVGYYRNLTTWHVGTSIEGCFVIQNDIDIITKGESKIPLRVDDHGNTRAVATNIAFSNSNFQSNGMINDGPDKDVFKIVVSKNSLLKTKVVPNSVGTGNSGANIDIKMSLLKSNGDTIGRYNPTTLLSASVDTNLMSGTYYFVIDGVANQNVDDYGSIGYYSMSGSLDAVLPITKLTVKGNLRDNMHAINWTFEADEPVLETIIECSSNGVDFKPISTLSPAINQYAYKPFANGPLYYRIKMLTVQDNKQYYSNIISLQSSITANISLQSNMITSTAQVYANGNYSYQVFDETGRMFNQGKLSPGLNHIPVNTIKKGILLLKIYNENDRHIFKLIKQ